MIKTVLLVTAVEKAPEIAATLSQGTHVLVHMARSRRAALALLRRHTYVAVLMDMGLPSDEVTTSEDVWRNVGEAVPLEIALAELRASGTTRLLRHVLLQCEQARESARQTATAAVEEKLRSTLTGLLLQSDLLMRDSEGVPAFTERAKQMHDITNGLRSHFN